MNRCSGYQSLAKKGVITLTALIGLLSVVSCGAPRNNLSDPAKFGTVEHALRTDLTKVDLDLGRERRDMRLRARGHRVSPCYNLKNNVNFDVLTVIHDFVVTTVTSNRNSMQTDMNHMRSDKSGFQRDITDFINDGVARPAGARKAIAAITTKISRAKNRANRLIADVNAGVRTAYRIANQLASAHCLGAGPGTAVPRVPPVG